MQWTAIYNDGTSLPQYNEDGSENRYADIDRTKLAVFCLCQDGSDVVVLAIHLEPNQRLIYRRRVALVQGCDPYVVYMCGWQQTVEGHNVQSIACIFPDNHIEWIGQWREDHEWFYSIQPLDCEASSASEIRST